MEEYLDIVDENGNPTGEKELRSVVHEKGLWHQVAVVYFFRFNKNNKLEFLTHLRSKTKAQHPNVWTARFGGHVESGSTIEETVKKEIKEEIGISIKLSDLIEGQKYFYDSFKEINRPVNREMAHIYYYNCKIDSSEFSFNDGEVQEIKWMTENEIIKSMDNNPEIWANRKASFLEILEDMKNRI